ncbi:MAG: YebC/PmpR family DNA-binding transcriptional regulator [Candidatus Glassbacteria bacterium]|nr:YebC/PmpR family DNA-binding transcriptional regulator [Candidatus Glassbacteria bacterium]
MSGHSKWATIKRKKSKEDERRGRVFTKLIKEISVAARTGGGDPDSNPRLRTAVDTAKAANMPKENIERAIKKGTGELPGASYEEAVYEGYGPGGVALYLEVLTDNKNRTVSEVRHLLTKSGGRMGEAGCVAWMFSPKGQVYIDAGRYDEETVMLEAGELGAEDMVTENELHVVTTSQENLAALRDGLAGKGIEVKDSEIVMMPSNTIKLEEKDAAKVLKLMESLEDLEDMQRVSSNFDIDEEVLEKLAAEES